MVVTSVFQRKNASALKQEETIHYLATDALKEDCQAGTWDNWMSFV